ncbi:MAG: TCR/Tet family MFS transporter, partial [Verrucomicrobia bacterium]|nr:TCR/Tet family MFS transporter [Verrucomicrobiota bacterium]
MRRFRRNAAVSFVLVVVCLDVLGFGLIIPILPKLVEELMGGDVPGASKIYGWLTALYFLMQFLFAPILGSLSDRLGRRPVILLALLGSAADYLFLALAPTVGWFFLGRAISGLTGASVTAAMAYVADVTPPEKRAQSFGLIGAMFGLGFVAGPALGGVLGDVSLRLPFLAAAGLTFLNWIYGLLVMPESLPPERRRPAPWGQAHPLGAILALRDNPKTRRLGLAYFLIFMGQMSLNSVWVLYAGYRYGWSVAEIGLSLAVFGVMAMIVKGGVVRVVIPWLGEAGALRWGLIITALSYAGYGLAAQGWMVYLILVLGSLGGVASPALQGLVSRTTPP